LTVKPSSSIPALITKKTPPGKLFIINIQETPLDSLAELRINYFCDEVMELLAEKMGVTV
jgi:NAD-dependent SIR2 family protein deacetylase